jgi:hypothetical protein
MALSEVPMSAPFLSAETKHEIACVIADGAKTGRWNHNGGNETGSREFKTQDGTEVCAAKDGIIIRVWVNTPTEMVEITEEWF